MRRGPSTWVSWTKDEIARLTALYPHMETCEVAAKMGRTIRAIRSAAGQRGLKKDLKMRRGKSTWTAQDIAELTALHSHVLTCEIAAKMDRTPGAIKIKAAKLGLKKDLKMRRGKSTQIAWTAGEIATLTALYPRTATDQVAREIGRTLSSVKNKASYLGLKKDPSIWTTDEIATLTALYPCTATDQVAREIGRTPGATRSKSRELGLKKDPIFSAAPVGAECVRRGYRWRKIADDQKPVRRNWRQVHLLLWEEAYGPIPAGHMVVFIDGDKSNIALDNLEIVSRQENMQRNSVQRYPADIRSALHCLGQLTRYINQEKTHEKQD